MARIDLDGVDAVFFDLDDTLVDTSGQLVPPALLAAAEEMIAAGLQGSIEAVHEYLLAQAGDARGADYFGSAVSEFGVVDAAVATRVASRGRRAYLTADVGDPELLGGALSLLERLATRCRLFLVTAGDPTTQRRKVERLGIGERFEETCWVASVDGEDKAEALAELLDRHGLVAERCVCVGDRVVGEIRDANRLGMRTVWMRRGEFRDLEPSRDVEVADHVVRDVAELGALLGLEREPKEC